METSSAQKTFHSIKTRWAEKLGTLNTVLDRLHFLNSLRDPHTGVYTHHGMSMALGNEQTHDILLKSHIDTFAYWQWSVLANRRELLRR